MLLFDLAKKKLKHILSTCIRPYSTKDLYCMCTAYISMLTVKVAGLLCNSMLLVASSCNVCFLFVNCGNIKREAKTDFQSGGNSIVSWRNSHSKVE